MNPSGCGLVEVDGDALVEVAEGAEVFGEGAAREEFAERGRGAELAMFSVCNHGVWLAVSDELVTLAEFADLDHQLIYLSFS